MERGEYRGRHWLDKLVDSLLGELEERYKSKGVLVFNGGLSVSGLQHIGRLRGEVLLVEAVRRELERRGFRVRQLLTLYTQDPWKGKRSQLEQFPDPEEARKYIGWPLARVPDPKGCHRSWVDHYWSDFGPYLKEFTDGRIEVVTTSELYKTLLREFILNEVLPLRGKVREVINKYRGRKPYPEDWIPVEPICEKCGRIDSTKALRVENGRVEYVCRHCGHRGVTDVSNAKLNWRIEWAGVWKVLGIDFEPYGKDHATPGGSRDSCVDLAVNVFGFKPPLGEWYEWVAIRQGGREADMSSSGFVGITPREWLEIAHPEILRFIYFLHPPHRKIVVDLEMIPNYYSQFYRAERIYFGVEEAPDPEEGEYLRRTYELSHPKEPPSRLPAQVPYTHAAILAQLIPLERREEILSRLRRTGHLPEDADEYSIRRALELVEKAGNWAKKYAPESLRISIIDRVPEDFRAKYASVFATLAEMLENLEEWREEPIKQAMIEATRELSSKERREFYREFYTLFVGKPYGPRAAPLLSLLDKGFVIERLRIAASLGDRGS